MSANLRRRLNKELAPAASRPLPVADGRTPAVEGMCTTRVSIAGHPTSVQFAIIEMCPHDLILVLHFLSRHSALVDSATGALKLELPLLADFPAEHSLRLCSRNHDRLRTQAATYVTLSSSPDLPDGAYLVTRIVDVLMARDVALAHTVVSVTDNTVVIPLLNVSLLTQVIPQDMYLVTLSSLDSCNVTGMSTDATYPCPGRNYTFPADEINHMIAPDLTPAQATGLHRPLTSYRDIIDFDHHPLGQTTVVNQQ